MKLRYFNRLAFVACTFTLPACGATLEQLRSRASFDLGCPANQLDVVEIDQRTRGVRGCGKQATYVESCTTADRSTGCTWVLNTDSR